MSIILISDPLELLSKCLGCLIKRTNIVCSCLVTLVLEFVFAKKVGECLM